MYEINVEQILVISHNDDVNHNQVLNKIKPNLKGFDNDIYFNNCLNYLIKSSQVLYARLSGKNIKYTTFTYLKSKPRRMEEESYIMKPAERFMISWFEMKRLKKRLIDHVRRIIGRN